MQNSSSQNHHTLNKRKITAISKTKIHYEVNIRITVFAYQKTLQKF